MDVERDAEREILMFGIGCVLVPDLTNVTLGKLQLHFIDRSDHNIRVISVYKEKIERILADLRSMSSRRAIKSKIFHCDATDIPDSVSTEVKADFIVTSPPYPNRYSYVWNTRPHLYFLDFFSGPREAADLDKRLIGGTWGTATSCLQKGILEPENEATRDACEIVVKEIRESDNLMANYVMKYFNLLAKNLLSVQEMLNERNSIAYVVGNSRIKKVYVETDVILERLIDNLGLGYSERRIERFRRRHSGKDLFESIVFANK